jgi:hypothetical protein
VLALSFQGQRVSILDYSRTARYPNEEVVILRELFVRRKPLTGVRSFPPILLGPRKTGRERPDFPIGCRTPHRECLVKMPVNLVNAREEDMRGACYGSCGEQERQLREERAEERAWNGS